jgi:hypothetical protein
LGEVPAAVEDAYRRRQGDRPVPSARLIEFIGGGINQWTAAEGALKIREAAYVASEGLAVEQFLHGPSVALGPDDRLVCLDGGGAWSARIAEVAQAAEQAGVPVTRVADDRLGELLSIFPLTVAVQRRQCVGYATFCSRIEHDEEFASWFARLDRDIRSLADSHEPGRARLAALQNSLMDLIDFLDDPPLRFPPTLLTRIALDQPG